MLLETLQQPSLYGVLGCFLAGLGLALVPSSTGCIVPDKCILVDGATIDSLDVALELYAAAGERASIRVGVIRDGRPLGFSYSFIP